MDNDSTEERMPVRLTAFSAFADPDLERRYREHYLASDARLLRVACLVLLIGVGTFLIADFSAATSLKFGLAPIVGLRIVVALFAGVAAYLAGRVRSAAALDVLVLLFALCVIALSLVVDYARPADYFTHIGSDVALLMGIYLILPFALVFKLAAGLSFTAALLAIHFGVKEPVYELTTVSVVVSLLVANLLGILFAFRSARTQRSEYYRLREARDAKEQLEKAHEDVETLSGLVPICAQCKKIRNDEGYWEQVEFYMRERTQLDFTHGLCPDCLAEYEV